jgi:hypothetical protein
MGGVMLTVQELLFEEREVSTLGCEIEVCL